MKRKMLHNMSHALEQLDNGEYSIAWAGETPWHGLGKRVPNDLTAEQMMQAANVDWTVSKRPLYRKIDDEFHVTNMTALTRDTDNKILDYVPESWNENQNRDAFNFFHDYVMEGDMEMHTAGSLKGGQIVWALAKLKNNIVIGQKDVIENYMLFSNPHKFGKSIDVRMTSVRVCCANTLSMSLNEKSNQVAKVSHRMVFNKEEVKRTMGIVDHKNTQYSDALNFLTTKSYTKDTCEEFMQKIFPGNTKNDLSRNANAVLGIIDTQPGGELFPGTWYNALQAVTFFNSHAASRSDDTRLYNQWFGSTQKQNITALNLALEMAN